MARNYIRYGTAFTAQASAAITADAFSGGTETEFDTSSSGNADGAEDLHCEIDVTTAPSTATTCEIWMAARQHDTTGDTEYRRVGLASVGTGAAKYGVPIYGPLPEIGKLKLKAIGYSMTASLSARSIYQTDA